LILTNVSISGVFWGSVELELFAGRRNKKKNIPVLFRKWLTLSSIGGDSIPLIASI